MEPLCSSQSSHGRQPAKFTWWVQGEATTRVCVPWYTAVLSSPAPFTLWSGLRFCLGIVSLLPWRVLHIELSVVFVIVCLASFSTSFVFFVCGLFFSSLCFALFPFGWTQSLVPARAHNYILHTGPMQMPR